MYSSLGIDRLDWEQEAQNRTTSLRMDLGFAAVWEAQSQLASLILVALVAFAPLYVTLAVMLSWSLIATAVYYSARRRGAPDLLQLKVGWKVEAENGKAWATRLRHPLSSAFRLWIMGFQAFLFSRALCPLLREPAQSHPTRIFRLLIFTTGFWFLGVTSAHHMLASAGYKEGKLLRLSLIGPFLNVPYRVLLSAIVISALMGTADAVTTYIPGTPLPIV